MTKMNKIVQVDDSAPHPTYTHTHTHLPINVATLGETERVGGGGGLRLCGVIFGG